MKALPNDLTTPALRVDGEVGDKARVAVHSRIQETKHAESHALDLVLDTGYADSPIIVSAAKGGLGRPGHRLPHVWLRKSVSLFDKLGPDLSLALLDGRTAAGTAAQTGFRSAADRRRVPLTVVDLRRPDLQDRLSSGLLLVRPDQHVAWAADAALTDPGRVLDRVRSGPGPAGCRPLPAARPSVPPTCAARPAAGPAGRPFPTDADLPAETARTDQALADLISVIG